MVGAVSWALLILVFPIAGFAGLIAFVIIAIVFTVKRKRIFNRIFSIFMLNIDFPHTHAYPIDTTQATPSITIASPLKESAVVGWGGDDKENDLPHVIWASERWLMI